MCSSFCVFVYSLFFFTDTATTEIYTLSLHDALPICSRAVNCSDLAAARRSFSSEVSPASRTAARATRSGLIADRKSTRLNSSHSQISYAVFCLKKKKKKTMLNHSEHVRVGGDTSA